MSFMRTFTSRGQPPSAMTTITLGQPPPIREQMSDGWLSDVVVGCPVTRISYPIINYAT